MNRNIPSLELLVNKLALAFRRFPVAILLMVAGSVFAMMFLHLSSEEKELHQNYLHVVMSCYLGMLLFISLSAYSERLQIVRQRKIILSVAGLLVLILYDIQLPYLGMAISTMQFVLFAIGLHLLIAFASFLRRNEVNGFWQYNKILFLRILTSAFISAILFIGLLLAILSIDQLFKIHANEKIYGDLWIFIAGIFNTWFFLAVFPEHIDELERNNDYPKGLKILTQYLLLPLVTIYLLILYAYMFRIIFTAQWPVGWVSYLVIGFSIAGIFSLLLIHPIRNQEGNQWMRIYSRFFYMALFPLVILLFLAIKKRMGEYGITENRYFILVLALWLVSIATYFLFSKSKNIKLIPISLCAIAFLTSFGPWGAFQVSMKSQKKHFVGLLEKNKLLVQGKIIRATDTIPFDNQWEISSVVEYLCRVHGYPVMQDFFSQNLDSLMKAESGTHLESHQQANRVLGLMNLMYVSTNRSKEYEENHIDFRADPEQGVSLAGFNYCITDYRVNNYDSKDTVCSSYDIESESVKICFNTKRNTISVKSNADAPLLFDVAALIRSLKEKKYADLRLIKKEDMTMVSSNERFLAKIILKNLYGEQTRDSIMLRRVEADIFFQFKSEKENEVGERNRQ